MIRYCYKCGVKLRVKEAYEGYKEQFNNDDIKHFISLWSDNRIQFLCCKCFDFYDYDISVDDMNVDDINVDNMSHREIIFQNKNNKWIVNVFDYLEWKLYDMTIGWYGGLLEKRLENIWGWDLLKKKWRKGWSYIDDEIEIIIGNDWLMKIFNRIFGIMSRLRKILSIKFEK